MIKQPCYSEQESDKIDLTRAQEVLARAKKANQKKRYELRIDDRTTILVEKRNHNRAYAEAYRAKINKTK